MVAELTPARSANTSCVSPARTRNRRSWVAKVGTSDAKKGVFITTGTFSSEAIEYVGNIDPKVVLIDGRQLADFMIDFGIGVTESSTYHVKRIDSDYFGEE